MSEYTRSESCWTVRDEGRTALAHTVREGELELRRKELLDVGPADIIAFLDLNDTKDLRNTMRAIQHCNHKYTHVNRPETGTVPRSHVLVKGLDGVGAGEIGREKV